MIVSIAVLVILGLLFNYLFSKIKLPGLLGMLLVGVLCGPHALNIIAPELMQASEQLRQVALIIILLRAGFEIRKDTLKRIGKTALALSALPALFEAAFITVIAPVFFNLTYFEAGILGCIVAAISPAVVIPLMIELMDKKVGATKSIPTMILASSTVNNILVIVAFTIMLGFYGGEGCNLLDKLVELPVILLLGLLSGIISGFVLNYLFDKFNPRATKMALSIIAVTVILTWLQQDMLKGLAALIGAMAIGFIILEKAEERAQKISQKLAKIWIFAEIILFVLVGAEVNIHLAGKTALLAALLVILALLARSLGTYLSVIKANYNFKEKLFCIIAYAPKATVQAAIGSIPLQMCIPGGEIILTVSVMSIIVTAPLGAACITILGDKLLQEDMGS